MDNAQEFVVMEESGMHRPPWLRQQALRCFRLAEQTWDDATRDALVGYGRELLERAERMEKITGEKSGGGAETGEAKTPPAAKSGPQE
jgi:hypothetical protein